MDDPLACDVLSYTSPMMIRKTATLDALPPRLSNAWRTLRTLGTPLALAEPRARESSSHRNARLMVPLDRVFRLAERQLGRIEYRVVETLEEMRACCRLVHDEYVQRDYITPQANRLKLSRFHVLPSTTTFVARHPERGLLGTVTLIEDSPLGLPMDETYDGELNALRQKEQYLAEASMFTLNSAVFSRTSLPTFRAVQLAVTLRLFKVLFDYLRSCTPMTELVACLNPKHEILYDCLHFKPLSGPKPYPMVNGTLGVARHLNVIHAERFAASEPISHFFYTQRESALQFVSKLVLSTDNLKSLFAGSGSPLAAVGARELAYIRSCYPSSEGPNLFLTPERADSSSSQSYLTV
jgi:hypothetical protein